MVAAALAREDGRWLMHRRPSHKHHGGLWEFPGGKVELGETPEIAMVRELAEELGVVVDGADLVPAGFATSQARSRSPGVVILLYTVRIWRGDPVACEAGARIDWFLAEDIAQLDKPPLDVALVNRLFGLQDGAG